MNDLDPKKIIDGIHTATELAKDARGLIKQLTPLVRRIPWRSIARGFAWGLRKLVKGMFEMMRLPEPWPRACLAIKFSLTVLSYFVFMLCLALLVANCDLIFRTHLSAGQSVGATIFIVFATWGTAVAFAQAEWLRYLIAKNSRILWGHR